MVEHQGFIWWMMNHACDSCDALLCLTLTKQFKCVRLRDLLWARLCCLCLCVGEYAQMIVIVALCDSLFSLLLLCIHVNMYADHSGQCVFIFAFVCKATNWTSFILFQNPERMSNSKAVQRKCGPWLHGWLAVLFTQCVLYGITLVKVLSTRIVSISSTLSLILQPNPSMSENMCGLAIRSELDGISQQCVTEAQRSLCSLDSWDVTYRVRFAFNMPAVFDFLNGVSLRHEIEVSCGHVLLPLENRLISHSSNDHSYPKQFEQTMRGVCSLRAVHAASYDPCVASQCVCSSSTLQWLNLIKNVLTTLQYS